MSRSDSRGVRVEVLVGMAGSFAGTVLRGVPNR
jgi:hypothetical protein